MRLRHLLIANTKLLEAFQVDFQRPDGSTRLWTVFVGENGKCKTTILQCIALAASGPEKSNQLAGDLPSRLPDARGVRGPPGFTAQFESSARFDPFPSQIDSAITSLGSVFEGTSESRGSVGFTHPRNPLSLIRSRNSPGWLCVGYGVNRNIPVPFSVELRSDPAQDRVKSLFDPRYQLVGTDFVGRFEAPLALRYSQLLQQALIGFGILPDISSLELRGRGGVTHPAALVEAQRFDQKLGNVSLRLPAIALSHGYQSTIAWVADLIGQAMVDAGERAGEVELETLEGVVLIDEIDLHLHPKWQRSLVRSLKAAFPRLQFIATTHSPLVLAGLAEDEVWILESDERGSVTARSAAQSARLMTASGILQTFFDVDRVDPDDAGGKLREYGFLASTAERTDEEQGRLEAIRAELTSLGVEPQWEPLPRSTPEASGHSKLKGSE